MKIEYAETIPNLKIQGKPAPYPVVNEREIRAAAGIMFFLGFATFSYIFATRDYTPLYILVPLFWLDFLIKTAFSAKWSIFGMFGSLIVKKQKPEYVGAIQKRFAWGIGLFLATTMMIAAIGFGIRGILPFTICSICLFFMWLESACGICVGCKIYNSLIKSKHIKEPQHKPACPGGSCSVDL